MTGFSCVSPAGLVAEACLSELLGVVSTWAGKWEPDRKSTGGLGSCRTQTGRGDRSHMCRSERGVRDTLSGRDGPVEGIGCRPTGKTAAAVGTSRTICAPINRDWRGDNLKKTRRCRVPTESVPSTSCGFCVSGEEKLNGSWLQMLIIVYAPVRHKMMLRGVKLIFHDQ